MLLSPLGERNMIHDAGRKVMSLRNQDVPAFDSRGLAAGPGFDPDLLAQDVDRGLDIHLEGALGAVDFDDHGVAWVGIAMARTVVDAVDAGLVPGIEVRLQMIPVGNDLSDRHLDPNTIALHSYLRHPPSPTVSPPYPFRPLISPPRS